MLRFSGNSQLRFDEHKRTYLMPRCCRKRLLSMALLPQSAPSSLVFCSAFWLCQMLCQNFDAFHGTGCLRERASYASDPGACQHARCLTIAQVGPHKPKQARMNQPKPDKLFVGRKYEFHAKSALPFAPGCNVQGFALVQHG